VQFNEVDAGAFRRASQPLLAYYRRDPDIDQLYQRIRALA
jgi:endonuclease V-like protein UPF0215 family